MNTKSVNFDEDMKNIWFCLARDFRASLDSPDFARDAEEALRRSVVDFRNYKFPDRLQAPAYLHKCQYQLENLFKRCIFTNDMYTPDQLEKNSIADFLSFQKELSTPKKDITMLQHCVLQGARRVVRTILGDLDQEELYNACQFGKRAANGVPYAKSYLDVKVQHLSGSKEHISWFREYLSRDPHLGTIVGGLQAPYHEIYSLQLVTVPKTYKAYRIIEPNSVLGGFHSAGLGSLIERKLKENGLNIANLQKKHARYAKSASVNRKNVTADLSKASDSFDSSLLNRLLPRQWFNEIKRGRLSHVEINGSLYYQASFMAMGIGYTFPLETLLFYALLKSISELSGIKGRISVYGDDLIYPRKMHAYVSKIFPTIGLKINADKTFVTSHFRESCGADYYHGVEVRPCQPEVEMQGLGGDSLLSVCYKLYNGLLLRWDPAEIPSTLVLLKRIISSRCGVIHQVPPSFPDTAGIKVPEPQSNWVEPWSPVLWDNFNRCWSFKYLRKVSLRRTVHFIFPYYWESLRSTQDREAINPFTTVEDMPILKWHVSPNRKVRSGLSGELLKKMFATVADKARSRELVQQGSTPYWVWDI